MRSLIYATLFGTTFVATPSVAQNITPANMTCGDSLEVNVCGEVILNNLDQSRDFVDRLRRSIDDLRDNGEDNDLHKFLTLAQEPTVKAMVEWFVREKHTYSDELVDAFFELVYTVSMVEFSINYAQEKFKRLRPEACRDPVCDFARGELLSETKRAETALLNIEGQVENIIKATKQVAQLSN